MRIGPTELGLILVIVLILFGAGRLPQVFAQFGKGIKAFRDAQKDEEIDVTRPEEDKPKGEIADSNAVVIDEVKKPEKEKEKVG
jgi:sec-independent protein translocase protein TatA